MKSLVQEKLPHISNTLEESGIDVTVVTFNWFLTLFIDALPTEVCNKMNKTLSFIYLNVL